jgi:hypothetical protein
MDRRVGPFSALYRACAEQLAAADPAGVRKDGEAVPAGMRENE